MADGDHARLQRGTPNNTMIIIIYLQSGASLVVRSCFGWILAMINKKSRQKKQKACCCWESCWRAKWQKSLWSPGSMSSLVLNFSFGLCPATQVGIQSLPSSMNNSFSCKRQPYLSRQVITIRKWCFGHCTQLKDIKKFGIALCTGRNLDGKSYTFALPRYF